MGYSSYSTASAANTRSVKSTLTNTVDQNFKQNRLRKAHELMKSQGIILREARDSDIHPNTFPIIIALDLTGSMQEIPQELIKVGLPKLISGIIQGGVQSPALLFLGVGDHECDDEPLQVAQFESGDVELDGWLEKTYLEGGGGSNRGESYSLAHYFASRHTATDSFDKRGVKGVLITIGDEPNLSIYPAGAIQTMMGGQPTFEGSISDKELLKEAQEKWEVFHINPRDNGINDWRNTSGYWKNFLGQNYIGTNDYTKIPDIIRDLVVRIAPKSGTIEELKANHTSDGGKPTLGEIPKPGTEEEIL